MVASVFAIILGVLKAIPPLKDLFDRFLVFYAERQIANMKKENVEAIRKAMDEQDQREIEKAMGSSKAGEPTGVPGSRIVDSVHGVRHSKTD